MFTPKSNDWDEAYEEMESEVKRLEYLLRVACDALERRECKLLGIDKSLAYWWEESKLQATIDEANEAIQRLKERGEIPSAREKEAEKKSEPPLDRESQEVTQQTLKALLSDPLSRATDPEKLKAFCDENEAAAVKDLEESTTRALERLAWSRGYLMRRGAFNGADSGHSSGVKEAEKLSKKVNAAIKA